MTTEEREQLVLRSAVEDVQTWLAHSLVQVQSFEEALFTYFVLARNEAPEQARRRTRSAWDRHPGPLAALRHDDLSFTEEQVRRLAWLVGERDWLLHWGLLESQPTRVTLDQARALRMRLEAIADEARSLQAEFLAVVEQHLSRSGLAQLDIQRKTGEATQLWRTAA